MVTDIFFLDLFFEFCSTPLQAFNYLDRRVKYFKQVFCDSEQAVLGFHLQKNLFLEKDEDFAAIDKHCADELDACFTARRLHVSGGQTPDGILTRFNRTEIGKLIDALSIDDEPTAISFGLALLYLSEELALKISNLISGLKSNLFIDRDFSLMLDDGHSGITFHSNHHQEQKRREGLISHCILRKQATKCDAWYGVSINPLNKRPFETVVYLNEPWRPDHELDKKAKRLIRNSKPRKYISGDEMNRKPRDIPKVEKVGRNAPCPCGSGKKYKKCCIDN